MNHGERQQDVWGEYTWASKDRRRDKNIPYTTQYPCREEEVRMMRVEHADHQQDGGGVRWAAFLQKRTEDRTSIQKTGER